MVQMWRLSIYFYVFLCIQQTQCFLSPYLSRHRHIRLSDKEGMREEEVRNTLRETREMYDEAKFGASTSSEDESNSNYMEKQFISNLKSKRPYLSILLERTMQNIDDMQIATRNKENAKSRTDNLKYSHEQGELRKEKIVILGSGWGAHAFLKTIDADRYEVICISPRNYFLFTPMLAASAVGTVDFRSICEPIRNANPLADYLEATAIQINSTTNSITCRSVKCVGISCEAADFTVSYDYLVVAVGATPNTFGIKGVRENCLFLKQIEDASNLRAAISYCFERANIPGLTEQERRDALSFVIVGAGPTGVEFTSELRDFVESEGRRYFTSLLKYVTIRLLEAGDAVLPVFDKALQIEALNKLTNRKTSLIENGLIDKEMTSVSLRAGVKEITEKCVKLSSGEEIPYGFCVWAAGNGPVPVVLDLIAGIPEQKDLQQQARGRLVTDPWQRVLGAEDILCIGDCGFSVDNPLPATAQVASQQGSYIGRLLSKGYVLRTSPVPLKTQEVVTDKQLLPPSERLNLGELGVTRERLKISASNSTAEVQAAKPFQFLNLGVLAYIGASEALTQVSVDEKQILGSGPIGFLLWRGIYWAKQVSWRNRLLVGIDWAKARIFGRDIGSI